MRGPCKVAREDSGSCRSPPAALCAAPARRPAPSPPHPGKRALSGASAQPRARERSGAPGARPGPRTLGGRPCPTRPWPAALPSAALRCPARRGRGRGRGRAGEAGPSRRVAAGMRSWRRNLALCLQRLPDEGRTRPLPTPVSTRAARGAEGGPSARLAGGARRGSLPEAKGDGRLPPRRGRGAPRSGELEGVTVGLAVRSAPGRGKPGRGLHEARGGGLGRRLWTLQGAALDHRSSPVAGAARAGAATTCLFAPCEFVVGLSVRTFTPGALGSWSCSRWNLTLLLTPFGSPAPTPESAVPQSCKEAGGRRERVRGGRGPSGASPCPAGPCRSAAAQPPPPRCLRGRSTAYLLSGPLAAEGGGRGIPVWALHSRGKFGFRVN